MLTSLCFIIDKKIHLQIDATIERDREKFKHNANGLAVFLPERVYSDTRPIDRRKVAFQTLSNLVTVHDQGRKLTPLIFKDSILDNLKASQYKRFKGEWRLASELKVTHPDEPDAH